VNYATFKTRIADHLNRTDLTSQIPNFVTLAIKRLEKEKLYFQQEFATVATVASTAYASLPTDFLQDIRDGLIDSNGTPITKANWKTVMADQAAGNTGEPKYYCVMKGRIYFMSIPDAIYSYRFLYYKSLTALSLDADTNDWLSTAWDATFHATLCEAWKYLNNDGEIQKEYANMQEKLMPLRSISGKITGSGTIAYREY
jgi:hypothetical protein